MNFVEGYINGVGIAFLFLFYKKKNWKTTVDQTVYYRWLAPRNVFRLLSMIALLNARKRNFLGLRWLKAVSSTFQDIDFDVSLLPLVIT